MGSKFNKKDDNSDNQVVDKEPFDAKELIEKNDVILHKIEELAEKVDLIDKNNKKFLMAASMNKLNAQENKIKNMKLSVIDILDNVDVLLNQVEKLGDDTLNEGIGMISKGILDSLSDIDLEVIPTAVGDVFNPAIHNCIETGHKEDIAEDTILAINKKGYKDLENGLVIRTTEVVVNKK